MTDSTEHNILRALPFFLLALMVALVGWADYRGYKSVKPRPKPVATQLWYEGKACDGSDCSKQVGNIATTWIACNAGMEVTDLRMCPEYREHSTVGLDLAYAWSQRPRKHKRKKASPTFTPDTDGYFVAGPGLIISSGVTSYERSFMQIVGDKELDFRQWDKAGSHYTIDASPDAFDCPAEFEDSADHMHSQLVIRCTPRREDFPDTTIIDRRKPTTPQVITNLMEQIAPTTVTCPETGCPIPLPESWHVIPTGKPDCKMPADVDVCPTQTLDKKASHD